MLILTIVCCHFVLGGQQMNVLAANSNPSIIVVGSGASGIAAATRLLKYNFSNILILEAENRIGGRINSIPFGDALVDMGAQFCHGEEDNIVYSLVKDLRVLRHSSKKHQFYYSNGEVIEDGLGERLVQFAESLEGAEEPVDVCENVKSIGECLEIKFQNFSNSLQDQNEKHIVSDSSDWITSHLCALDSPFDINDLKITSAYKKCEGDLRLNWNGLGYKVILDIMMKKLAIDDKIIVNTEVTRIAEWSSSDNLTVISTSTGAEYHADHVIVTTSLGVLKANHERLFDPPLPQEKVEAIRNIGFGAILKIQIHFPLRSWSEDANWIFIWSATDKQILKEKNLEWLLNVAEVIQGDNNPNVLTAWYAGSYVPLIEKLSENDVLEGQNYLIKTFLGRHHHNITLPDRIIRSTWYSNPHFRGTYSYESVKGHSGGGNRFPDALGSPLTNKNNKPTILFAGEATHPHYFSTVHGAIETGYREADRLIQFYRNNP